MHLLFDLASELHSVLLSKMEICLWCYPQAEPRPTPFVLVAAAAVGLSTRRFAFKESMLSHIIRSICQTAAIIFTSSCGYLKCSLQRWTTNASLKILFGFVSDKKLIQSFDISGKSLSSFQPFLAMRIHWNKACCGWWSVWPDKNHQMSIKVAQKWFH